MSANVPTRVRGHRVGFVREVGPPATPHVGVGKHKKHVLEVSWMVISGYLPL